MFAINTENNFNGSKRVNWIMDDESLDDFYTDKELKFHVISAAVTPNSSLCKRLQKRKSSKRPFKCKLCKRMYKTNSALWSHNRDHFPHRHCSCPNCHDKLRTYDLSSNNESLRDVECQFECKFCGQIFPKIKNLTMHLQLHEDNRNGNDYMGISQLDNKLLKPFNDKDTSKICRRSEGGHVPHNRTLLQCRFCPKNFRSIEYLRTHEYRHHKCDGAVLIKGQVFSDYQASIKYNFQCLKCGKAFTSKSNFISHKRFAHQQNHFINRALHKWNNLTSGTLGDEMGDSNCKNNLDINLFNSLPYRFSCDKCHKTFRQFIAMKRHVNRCMFKHSNATIIKSVQPDIDRINLRSYESDYTRKGELMKQSIADKKNQLITSSIDLLTNSNTTITSYGSVLIPNRLVAPTKELTTDPQKRTGDLICFQSELELQKSPQTNKNSHMHLPNNFDLICLSNDLKQFTSTPSSSKINLKPTDNSTFSFQLQAVLYEDDSPQARNVASNLSNVLSFVKTTVEFPVRNGESASVARILPRDINQNEKQNVQTVKLIDYDEIKCKICNKLFWSESTLLQHEKEHSSELFSKQCFVHERLDPPKINSNRKSVQPSNTSIKKRLRHTCVQCGKKFGREEALEKHLECCNKSNLDLSITGKHLELPALQKACSEGGEEILYQNKFMSKSTISTATRVTSSIELDTDSNIGHEEEIKVTNPDNDVVKTPAPVLSSKFSTYLNIVSNTLGLLEKSLSDAEAKAYIKPALEVTEMPSVEKLAKKSSEELNSSHTSEKELQPEICKIGSGDQDPNKKIEQNVVNVTLSSRRGSIKTFATNPLRRPISSRCGMRAYCDVCNKAYKNVTSLMQHKKTHRIHPITCGLSQKFNSPSSLSIHETSFKRDLPFQCSLCDKDFSSQAKLRYHVLHVHAEASLYECDVCEKIFLDSDILLAHRKAHESDIHMCELCQQIFDCHLDLKYHIMTKHYKAIKCEICSEQFSTYSDLNQHTETDHQYARRYKCTLCTSSFSSIKDVINHKATHPKSKKEFACNRCEVSYTKDVDLYTHFANVHNDNIPVTPEHV